VIVRRLPISLVMAAAAVMLMHGSAFAQGAFPAPLPSQSQPAAAPASASSPFPPAGNEASPFPPVNGAGQGSFPAQGAAPIGGFGGGGGGASLGGPPPGPSPVQEECMKRFIPLRKETERRASLIKAASDRHAPPQEACKIIGSFSQSEAKLVNFVTTQREKCGIPPEIGKQMIGSHAKTEQLLKRVCSAASSPQAQAGAAGPTLSEVLGGAALPVAPAAPA
jgi:hypothetical protein